MKNIAGETKADLYILKELSEAGIEIVQGTKSKGEVPYTISGKLADWNFSRAWYYWVASASKGGGLPLDIATELHNRTYPIVGEREPKTYGQAIRVAGHCGCPPPKEWATHYDAQGLQLIIDSKGKQEAEVNLMRKKSPERVNEDFFKKHRFVKSLKGNVAKSVIDNYHVDTQEGLNELSGTIRKLHDMVSSGTDAKEIVRLYDKISALYTTWEAEQKQEGVEWLKKMPTILYGDGSTVNELTVAIKDEQEVVSIAKKLAGNQRGGIVQHFFKDGQITGFNYGFMSGPGQILNRGPEIDEKLRPHYEELKTLRPKAALSLEICMQRLETPGPQYTGRSDGSISLNLAAR